MIIEIKVQDSFEQYAAQAIQKILAQHMSNFPEIPITCLIKRDNTAQQAGLIGLPSDIIGKYIHHKREVYKVVGFKTSRPKMPVELLRVRDNNSMKCSVSMVQAMIRGGNVTTRPFKSEYDGDQDFEQALVKAKEQINIKLDLDINDIDFTL